MTSVQAAVATGAHMPFEVRELELDALRPDEVRVRMVASGVCHTDAITRDGYAPIQMPAVLGHEGAGVVDAVGDAVSTVAPGDHVVLSFAHCGVCAQCRQGRPAYCSDLFGRNFAGARPDGSRAFSNNGTAVSSHFFGQSSFASMSNVAERSVVKVRDDVPLELLGPLGCGIQTGAGAVLNALDPPAGSSLAVFGVGAVGSAAMLGGLVAGCTTVIAVDVVDSRLDLARELGATHAVNAAKEDPVEAITAITAGGLDYAVETSAVPSVLRQAADALGVGGTVALVGAQPADAETTFNTGATLLKGWSFRTVIEGDAVPQLFIPQMIDLWQAGRFPFDALVGAYDLDDVNRAFLDSEQGRTIKPVLRFA